MKTPTIFMDNTFPEGTSQIELESTGKKLDAFESTGKKIDAFELMTLLSSKIIHRLFEVEGEDKLIQEFTTKYNYSVFEENLHQAVSKLFSKCIISKHNNPNMNVRFLLFAFVFRLSLSVFSHI